MLYLTSVENWLRCEADSFMMYRLLRLQPSSAAAWFSPKAGLAPLEVNCRREKRGVWVRLLNGAYVELKAYVTMSSKMLRIGAPSGCVSRNASGRRDGIVPLYSKTRRKARWLLLPFSVSARFLPGLCWVCLCRPISCMRSWGLRTSMENYASWNE